MRRWLGILWWWASRALAVLGVLLALALGILDGRSRIASDLLTIEYIHARSHAQPPHWRHWLLEFHTTHGRINLEWYCGHYPVIWGERVDTVYGQPWPQWPASHLYFSHWQELTARPNHADAPQPTAVRRWLARLGIAATANVGGSWGENLPLSPFGEITLPLWPFTLLSLLPALILLYRWWRRRRGERGFMVVMDKGPAASSECDPPAATTRAPLLSSVPEVRPRPPKYPEIVPQAPASAGPPSLHTDDTR